MKSLDFERILADMGFQLVRINSHRIWSNSQKQIAVPNSKEINRMVARRILKEIGYSQSVPSINYYAKKIA